MESAFIPFSWSHLGALMVMALMTWYLIYRSRRADPLAKYETALMMSGVTFSTHLIEVLVRWLEGSYHYMDHLPYYLCDIMSLILPWVIYYRNRKWLGILYFWALAGTLQALLTPDVDADFPSIHFFRYFIMHGGIVAVMLYIVIVWKLRIRWRDFVNAILYAQVYLVCVHLINSVLSTNFSYTMRKPPGPSVLDLFGPWPWYIFGAEVIMIILFLLLMIPFMKRSDAAAESSLFIAEESE